MKNRISRLSATEAAREFSKLLDRVEAGEEVIIERHSKPVAVIAPPERAPRLISESLAIKLARPSVLPDPDFAKDLEEIIQTNPSGGLGSWE